MDISCSTCYQTIFYCSYKGKADRKTVKYKFGNKQTPFYEDLKRKSDEGHAPWDWYTMKQQYSSAKIIIANLVNTGKYEFTLSGQFEDIVGTSAHLHFFNEISTRRTSKRDADPVPQDDPASSVKSVEFTPQPGDPAPPHPQPPVVEIKAPDESNLPRVESKII